MPFDQSTLTSVTATVQGTHYLLKWTSTSPPGTWWQIYVGNLLADSTQANKDLIPIPSSRQRIEIGAVAPGEEYTDFSADLPAAPTDYVQLTWIGGSFESAELAGFHVYSSAIAGGPVNYSDVIGDVTAYPSGILTDGFGFGGFGDGGFGSSASTYTWTSGELSSGAWTFSVVPYDDAGNEGTPTTAVINICTPPSEPSAISGTARVIYAYSASTHDATLTWGASTP